MGTFLHILTAWLHRAVAQLHQLGHLVARDGLHWKTWGPDIGWMWTHDRAGFTLLGVGLVLAWLVLFLAWKLLIPHGVKHGRRVKQRVAEGTVPWKEDPKQIKLGEANGKPTRETNPTTGKIETTWPEGEARIPRELEYSHMVILGKTGTGKTQLFHQTLGALDARRVAGEDCRAVILDTKGDFLQHYWRPGDLIFNPLDKRCMNWCLFKDIRPNSSQIRSDVKRIAASLIPTRDGDGESANWKSKARSLLAEIIEGLYREDRLVSNQDLDKLIRKQDPVELIGLLATCLKSSNYLKQFEIYNPAGRNLVDDVFEILKTNAGGVIESLPPNANRETGMGLRDWVVDGERGQWLFLTRRLEDAAHLNQIYASIINMIGQFQMSLPEDGTRHISYVLDELPTAGKVDQLVPLLTVGRSKRASAVIGLQSYKALESIYGEKEADIILENAGTLAVLRLGEATAQKAANLLGKKVGLRETEGTSSGGGRSTSQQFYDQHLVNASMLMSLPKLSRQQAGLGYVRTDVMGTERSPYPKPTKIYVRYQGNRLRKNATGIFVPAGQAITWPDKDEEDPLGFGEFDLPESPVEEDWAPAEDIDEVPAEAPATEQGSTLFPAEDPAEDALKLITPEAQEKA